jgi:hypothetical protein
LANTGVLSGIYGGATQIPVICVNNQGQLTSVSNSSITLGTIATQNYSNVCITGGNVCVNYVCSNTCMIAPIICASTCFVGSGAGITGINTLGGGSTITCSATSYTLTSADCRAIGLCFCSLPPIACLILPNATTINSGSPAYTVKNLNPNTVVLVQDSCFCTVGYISSCSVGQISLYNNSQAQGNWAVINGGVSSCVVNSGTSCYSSGFQCASCVSFLDANNKIHTVIWSCTLPCVCTITYAPTASGYNVTSTSFTTCACKIACIGAQTQALSVVCQTNDGFILIENRFSGQNRGCANNYSNNTVFYVINCDSTAYTKFTDNTLGNTSFCGVTITCFPCSNPNGPYNADYTCVFNNHIHLVDYGCTCSGNTCVLHLDRVYYTVTGTTGTPTMCSVFTYCSFDCWNATCGCYTMTPTVGWCSVPNKIATMYQQVWTSNTGIIYNPTTPGFFGFPLAHKLFCYYANGCVSLSCAPYNSALDNGTFNCYNTYAGGIAQGAICYCAQGMFMCNICGTPIITFGGGPYYGVVTSNSTGYYCFSCIGVVCAGLSGYECLFELNRVTANSNLFFVHGTNCYLLGCSRGDFYEYCCACPKPLNCLTGSSFSFYSPQRICVCGCAEPWVGIFGGSGDPAGNCSTCFGRYNYAYHYGDKDRGCTFANPGCLCCLQCFTPTYLLYCDTPTCAVFYGHGNCTNATFGPSLAIWTYAPGTAPVVGCAIYLCCCNTCASCSCCSYNISCTAMCNPSLGGVLATCSGYTLCMGTLGVICSYNLQGHSFAANICGYTCLTGVPICAKLNYCISCCSNSTIGCIYYVPYCVGANTLLNFSSCGNCGGFNGSILSYNLASYPAVVTCLGSTCGTCCNCLIVDYIPSTGNYIAAFNPYYINSVPFCSPVVLVGNYCYLTNTLTNNYSCICLLNSFPLYANALSNQVIFCSVNPGCYVATFTKVKLT